MSYINSIFGPCLTIDIVNSEELGETIECSNAKFVYYNNNLIELNEKKYYCRGMQTIICSNNGDILTYSDSDLFSVIQAEDVLTINPIFINE